MIKLRQLLPRKDRECLKELRAALIIAPAIQGKDGNALYIAARHALKRAGIKRPRSLKRIIKKARGAA